MLKDLLNFKVSKPLRTAKIILLAAILAAIVITAFGLVEIMDVKAMKATLDVSKLIMGDVLLFLVKKYLVWALLLLFAGLITFWVVRYQENNKKQAAA